MNKSAQLSTLLVAAGISGVALFALANFAALSGIAIADAFAFAAAAAIVAFAVADYARQPKRLRLPASSLTPAPRAQSIAAAAGPRARASAYGLPRSRNHQRLAA